MAQEIVALVLISLQNVEKTSDMTAGLKSAKYAAGLQAPGL